MSIFVLLFFFNARCSAAGHIIQCVCWLFYVRLKKIILFPGVPWWRGGLVGATDERAAGLKEWARVAGKGSGLKNIQEILFFFSAVLSVHVCARAVKYSGYKRMRFFCFTTTRVHALNDQDVHDAGIHARRRIQGVSRMIGFTCSQWWRNHVTQVYAMTAPRPLLSTMYFGKIISLNSND